MTGVVTRVIGFKGYGFIKDEDGHERFICAADFVSSHEWVDVKEGTRLLFTPVQKPADQRKGPKDNGLRASAIEVLS